MAEQRPYVPSTPEEMLARRLDVERLMLAGLTVGQISTQLGLTPKRVEYVYREISEAWLRESETDQRFARAQVAQRLRRDLAQMRNPLPLRDRRTGEVVTEAVLDGGGQPVKRSGKPIRRTVLADVDWKAVDQHERLLAQVEGTLRPIEVKVDVDTTLRRSLTAVVASLDEARIGELLAEQEELEERASRAGPPPLDERH